MAWWTDWVILVLLVAIYALGVVALWKRGLLGKDRPFSLLGPALMIKTLRGRELLDRVARRRRFWNVYGDVGIVLGFVGMAVMFGFLLIAAVKASSTPASAAPTAAQALAIPGLNPLLPLGYGLLALVVGVVLHELAHGVLARANNIRVKSMGVLLLVIPLGAFVEQDDGDMMAAPRRPRDRVAAAGLMTNFVLAMVFFAALSLTVSTSVQAKADGVGVAAIFPGSPAQNASLTAGDIITGLNGTVVTNVTQLESALQGSHPGQDVPLQYYSQSLGGIRDTSILLTNASHFEGNASNSTLRHLAFMGVYEYPIPPQDLVALLTDPLATPDTSALANPNIPPAVAGALIFIVLPATSEVPIQGVSAEFFTAHGPLGFAGIGGDFLLVNSLYYLIWINLLLGIFNALPMVPLDGSLLFRDVVGGALQKARPAMTKERLDGTVGFLSVLISVAILLLFVWVFIGPHL